MKLEDLPEMPTDTRELIGATENAIRERLAYAKELLRLITREELNKMSMSKMDEICDKRKAFIEKLNSEGL